MTFSVAARAGPLLRTPRLVIMIRWEAFGDRLPFVASARLHVSDTNQMASYISRAAFSTIVVLANNVMHYLCVAFGAEKSATQA